MASSALTGVHAPSFSRYSTPVTPDNASVAENASVTGFLGVPEAVGVRTTEVTGATLSSFTVTVPVDPSTTTLLRSRRWSTVWTPLAAMVNDLVADFQLPPSIRYWATVPAGAVSASTTDWLYQPAGEAGPAEVIFTAAFGPA